MSKAVCLLSGGLDSATCLAIAQADGFDVHAISFDYGQRHAWELIAAKHIAERAHVSQHIVTKIDLRAFGGSALTSSEIAVPKGRDLDQMQRARRHRDDRRFLSREPSRRLSQFRYLPTEPSLPGWLPGRYARGRSLSTTRPSHSMKANSSGTTFARSCRMCRPPARPPLPGGRARK